MNVWSKLAPNTDWGGDLTFTHEDRQLIVDVLMDFARIARPENTIGVCAGGDPTYVWQAVIGNKFKELSKYYRSQSDESG